MAQDRSRGKAPKVQPLSQEQVMQGMADVVENVSLYRRALRSSQRSNFICVCLLAVLLAACIVLAMTRPKPVYFGMSQEMTLLPMVPLNEPLVSDAALESWLSKAITEAFNMDFLNYRERLAHAREYFTDDAFKGYLASLDNEKHLAVLRQFKAIMRAIPSSPPIVVRRGEMLGVMTWDLEMSVIVNYETSAKRIASQGIAVQCRVRRVPTTDFPQGIAIAQMVMTTEGPNRGRE
jgi:intracellular multiplication protein IcmL